MSKSDSVNSDSDVTLEWIESLPEEFKDEILRRFHKVVTSRLTLEESYALSQELYEMIRSGTKSPSIDSTASKTE